MRPTTVLLALALACVACRKDAGLPSKPRAIELTEEAHAPPSAPPITRTATRAAEPKSKAQSSGFPLPVIAGATVERQIAPVPGAARELQQVVLRSARTVPELAQYYERAMKEAGYQVRTRTGDDNALLLGRTAVGRSEATVAIVRVPDEPGTRVSMSITRKVKP